MKCPFLSWRGCAKSQALSTASCSWDQIPVYWEAPSVAPFLSPLPGLEKIPTQEGCTMLPCVGFPASPFPEKPVQPLPQSQAPETQLPLQGTGQRGISVLTPVSCKPHPTSPIPSFASEQSWLQTGALYLPSGYTVTSHVPGLNLIFLIYTMGVERIPTSQGCCGTGSKS